MLLAGSIVETECHWNFNRDASIAAAFALHQRTGSTKTSLRPLAGHRFVENEMRPKLESATHGAGTVDDRDRHGTPITRGRAGAFQDQSRRVLVRTVHNDGFKAIASQFTNGSIALGAMLDLDLQIAKHTAQHAKNLLVRTENECL